MHDSAMQMRGGVWGLLSSKQSFFFGGGRVVGGFVPPIYEPGS